MRHLRHLLWSLGPLVLWSLGPSARAQPTPVPSSVPLTVNKSTGVITGPVSAGTITTANSLVTLTGNQTLSNKTITGPSVATTGNITSSAGSVGIGTSTPLSLLHVSSAQNAESAVLIGQTDVNRWKIANAATTADFKISDVGGTYLTIKPTTGKVGIKTTAPEALLHVGANDNIANISDPGVLISRDLTDATGSGSGHGFADDVRINRTGSDSSGYAAFDARTAYEGTSNYDHYVGVQTIPNFGSSGTMLNMYGLWHAPAVTAGTVTNSYGLYINNPAGAGTVTNNFGLYIGAMTKGTTLNYGIYSAGSAPSYFGGNVSILGSIIRTGVDVSTPVVTIDSNVGAGVTYSPLVFGNGIAPGALTRKWMVSNNWYGNGTFDFVAGTTNSDYPSFTAFSIGATGNITAFGTGSHTFGSVNTIKITAGAITGTEIVDPSAPSVNTGTLYFRDNGSGKTQLVVRFPTGAVQVIATEP